MERRTEDTILEADGVVREVASLGRFLSENMISILVFSAIGFLLGLTIALTTNSYSPGLLLNSYQIKILPHPAVGPINRLQSKNSYLISPDFASFLRENLNEELTRSFTNGKDIQFKKIIVEELPPISFQLSSKLKLDSSEIGTGVSKAISSLVIEWARRSESNFQTLSTEYKRLLDSLYRQYESQKDLIEKVMAHVTVDKIRVYTDLFKPDPKRLDGEPYIDLRQFSYLLQVSSLDETEKRKIFVAFFETLRECKKTSLEFEALSISLEGLAKYETEAQHLSVVAPEASDISIKMVGVRIIIALSGLLFGIVLGVISASIKSSVLNFVMTIWKNETAVSP